MHYELKRTNSSQKEKKGRNRVKQRGGRERGKRMGKQGGSKTILKEPETSHRMGSPSVIPWLPQPCSLLNTPQFGVHLWRQVGMFLSIPF